MFKHMHSIYIYIYIYIYFYDIPTTYGIIVQSTRIGHLKMHTDNSCIQSVFSCKFLLMASCIGSFKHILVEWSSEQDS